MPNDMEQKLYDFAKTYMTHIRSVIDNGSYATRRDMYHAIEHETAPYLDKLEALYPSDQEAFDINNNDFRAPWVKCNLRNVLQMYGTLESDFHNTFMEDKITPDEFLDTALDADFQGFFPEIIRTQLDAQVYRCEKQSDRECKAGYTKLCIGESAQEITHIPQTDNKSDTLPSSSVRIDLGKLR